MRNAPRLNWTLADVIDDGTDYHMPGKARGIASMRGVENAPPPSSAAVRALALSRNVDALCDATLEQLEELFRLAGPGLWRDAVRDEYVRRFKELEREDKRRNDPAKVRDREYESAARKLRRREYDKAYARARRARLKAQAQ